MNSVVNLENLTYKTIDIARKAGAYIRQESRNFSMQSVETKGLHDFVSYVDKTAEMMIVEALIGLVPGAGFIAEEDTATKRAERYNWVIDPLDGTTNFIHGVPIFSVSIALMEHLEVVIGVVYEINLDECFYAWKGSAAYCNDKIIRVSDARKVADSLLVTGFPYADYGKLPSYLRMFEHFLRHSHGVRRLGSAAADLAWMACGRFEAFYEYGLNAWDVAAGALIVQQAGGRITDFDGGNNYIFGAELVASNGKIHDELMQTVRKYFPSKEPDGK
ncbi:MAG TPA: inositol monophosphatase family protein [Bacteroidales bacterium]|nr:inositol monophosphatase family protein [Bacteroidales bacterium]